MPTRPLSDEALQHTVEMWLEHGRSRADTCKAMGIPKQTLDHRLRSAEIRGFLRRVDGALVPTFPVRKIKPRITITAAMQAGTEPLPGATPMERSERVRLTDRIGQLEGEVKSLTRQLNEAEDIRKGLFGLSEAIPEPPAWNFAPAVHTSVTESIPLLFGSDYQWGEVVRPEEIDGLNEYNLDIAATRLERLIERTIDIARNHMGRLDVPGVIYARGGDAISGEIHEELAETNEAHAIPAVRHLLRHEQAAIKALRSEFGRVHVISIPGNHGRATLKKKSKGYTKNNFETLLSWWLESMFLDDANVTFQTPESGDAYFPIYGYRVLMSHGDRMGSSGGQGFLGPAATIIRGHKKLFDNFNRSGRPVDYILTGHFHTSLKLTHGYANGSLAGYSEYARDLRAEPAPPTQWLLFFHERRGVGARWEIELEERPMAEMVRANSAWWERGAAA